MEPIELVTTTGDTVTDRQSIAEKFNNYFVTVGKSMADSTESYKLSKKINPKVNSTSSSLFVSPCTPQELCDLIKKLKNKKAKRSLDAEISFISTPIIYWYTRNHI